MSQTAADLHREQLERSIRSRLEMASVIHLTAPERQEVAIAMQRRGEVIGAWGDGQDAGVLLVRRSALAPTSSGPGGDAA